jgi:uncharacterized protein DUF4384
MNSKHTFHFLSLALIVALSWPAGAQERGDVKDSRKAFLITRPKAAGGQNGKPARAKRPADGTIGLGYTVYQRDPNGKPMRVTASEEFHTGDAVRLMIESNTNGYFYVFHTENGENPKMIFPDARLKGGSNRMGAHVPYEVPSSREADPRFQWFHFSGKAATERLYLVVTRQPLPEVLTGKELVAHCQAIPDGCPWRPTGIAWNRIVDNAQVAALVSRAKASGQEQTAVERDRVSRDLGLPPGAPAPSVIKLSATPKARMLTLTIDLIHK